jgi:hypothetical protein
MTPLLYLTTALVLMSGLVKLKAWSRVGEGLHVLPLLETLLGVGLFGVVLVGPVGAGLGLWLVVGAVLLVVVSSVLMGLDIKRHRRRRELSEGARLATYVEYLSELPREK